MIQDDDAKALAKYNYAPKKRRQIQIDFDTEFPALPAAHSKKKKAHTQAATQSTTNNTKHNNRIMTGNNATANSTEATSVGGDSFNSFESYKNAIDSQIDMLKLQLEGMVKQQKAWEEERKASEEIRMRATNETLLMLRGMMDKLLHETKRTDKLVELFEEFTKKGKRTATDARPPLEHDGQIMETDDSDSDDSSKRQKQNATNHGHDKTGEALVTSASPRRND